MSYQNNCVIMLIFEIKTCSVRISGNNYWCFIKGDLRNFELINTGLLNCEYLFFKTIPIWRVSFVEDSFDTKLLRDINDTTQVLPQYL